MLKKQWVEVGCSLWEDRSLGVLGRAQKQPYLSSNVKCREVKVCHLGPGNNLGQVLQGPSIWNECPMPGTILRLCRGADGMSRVTRGEEN